MVKRVLSFVGREVSGLHEAAYLLAASAVASLVFALVRDRLLAHMLGAGTELDVYYAAFRVPDLIFVAVAGLVSTSVLVPLLSVDREKGEGELRASIQSLFSAFSLFILAVCIVAWILLPWIDRALYPALFARGAGMTLVGVSRILLLSPILLGLSGFFASITQIKNRFLVYALATPLYNVGIIFGIVFLLPRFGVAGIAWGVAIGAALLCLAQLPFVARDGLLPRLSLRISWAKVRSVAALSVPRTVTLSSQQATTLSLVSFASYLGAGSISIYNLALNLQSVPLSVIGASYSSAAFPALAKLLAEGKREEFLGRVASAARHIIFWSVPASVLFIVLRAQIVRTVLGTGQFSWSDTRLTAAALALFVVSSAGQSLMLLFVRSFYAEGKTRKPLLINVATTVVTVILGAALVKAFHAFPTFAFFIQNLLKTDGASDSSVLMLPLAFSCGALLNLYLHWRSFSREFPAFTGLVRRSAFRTVGASVVGGYAAYLSLRLFAGYFDLGTAVGVFLQGLCAGAAGLCIMGLVATALKSDELRIVLATIHQKIWRIDRTSLDQSL
jgi:putative peptidoglycan lipid II flippase